ncbi:kinase-like domain-containing protein [Gigaspora rosea]|uniref:Kinase-like domain-containing protein n=1 Tax=Gigaspora rosea TaxID=44941 RepID=A0A397VUP5_9GLOM|nr:kinase-like domain-containing protein [Gigaspora rosea]
MPYIAPEVLSGRPFTKAADIYAFGIIMSEMSTEQRPFDGYQFNIKLALSICNGIRPELALGTPECFIKLAKKCMDPIPEKRPLAVEVVEMLQSWIESAEGLDDDEIKEQFLDADESIKTLPTLSPSHPDHMYTSKSSNIQKLVAELKVYGKCEYCNQNNTSEAWCQTCDPNMEAQGWTSGNKNISNIQKLAEGGFGTVYSATWLDGIRKIGYVNKRYVRTREPSSEVALKTLACFEENSLLSLKEFNNHLKCGLVGIKLKVYGLTQNAKTKEYMMVAQYADSGNHMYTSKIINMQKMSEALANKKLGSIEIPADTKSIN